MFEQVDEFITKRNTKKRYSFLALAMTICTLIIFYNSVYYVDADNNKIRAPLFLVNALDISSVIGMIFTIISTIKKEPNSWQKWTAGILNVILFVLLIGSSIYALFIK